jgi:hypothetical protein
MVSRLNFKGIEMNTSIEMNMPIAETKNTDLSVLTDNDLDDVSGGYWSCIALGLAPVLGSLIGLAAFSVTQGTGVRSHEDPILAGA